jgi:hypothetical protein
MVRWARSTLTRSRNAPCCHNIRAPMRGSASALVLQRDACAAARVQTASLFRAESGLARCITGLRKCRGDSVRTRDFSNLFVEIGAAGNTSSLSQTAVHLNSVKCLRTVIRRKVEERYLSTCFEACYPTEESIWGTRVQSARGSAWGPRTKRGFKG